jgi:hypothetical protein
MNVAEAMERGIEHILEVRPECRGPTWGHAFRKNESRRAASEPFVSAMSLQRRDEDGDEDERAE